MSKFDFNIDNYTKEELLDSALLLRSKKRFSKKFPKKNNKNRKRY